MNLNSIKFKISILALLVLAVILIIYSGILLFSFRYSLYQELDSGLKAKTQKIHNAIGSYLDVLGYDAKSFQFSVDRVIARAGDHPHQNKIEKLEQLWLGQARPLGIGEDFVAFVTQDGEILSRSYGPDSGVPVVPARDLRAAFRGHAVYRDIQAGKTHLRSVLAPFTYNKLPRDRTFLLWVATSRERVVQQLKSRLIAELVGVTLILLVASFFSRAFVGRLLKPVRDITWTARNITTKDMSLRIKSDGVDEEMKDLVDSLNEMMSRLEKSFNYIAEFSSHVSHELKTPLAILRGESELALRTPRSKEEYRAVIQTNLEEIVRMTKIIEDLLLMTKLDYQPEIFKFKEFDLVELFQEMADSSRILAGEKDIRVEVKLPKEPVRIHGDAVHLRRLFFNLINNAVKFTPRQGRIDLEVARNGKDVRVAVSDTGVGIPEEHLPKVFDKFFHSNPGADDEFSNGLGLSIAQSIAKIHAGEIRVQSVPGGGSTFTVRLPLGAGHLS